MPHDRQSGNPSGRVAAVENGGAKVKKQIAAILILGLSLSGCMGTAGRKFEMIQVRELRKGQTTKQQVLAAFGEPNMTSLQPNGQEVLQYSYSKVKMSPLIWVPIIQIFFLFRKNKVDTGSLVVTLKNGMVSDCSSSVTTGKAGGLSMGMEGGVSESWVCR